MKRKEQSESPGRLRRISVPLTRPVGIDRVAQRAFRKRQKAYFKDVSAHHTARIYRNGDKLSGCVACQLEREVIDKGSQLRVITRNNEYLLQTMKQLQNENLAVSLAHTVERSSGS